jgi:hypothetical protein
VRLGSVPANSQQELRYLQDRLGLCGQIIFVISGMFLVVVGGLDYLRGGGQLPVTARALHLGSTLLALALWRLCRSRRVFSASMLATIDRGVALGVCAGYAAMGYFLPQPWGAYTALLAIVHVTVGRAVIVPSTAARTSWLALGSFAGGALVPRGHEPGHRHLQGRLRPARDSLARPPAGAIHAGAEDRRRQHG